MRGILIAGCAGLALAGCAGLVPATLVAPTNLASAEADVAYLSYKACQIVPKSADIGALLKIADPLYPTDAAIAQEICNLAFAPSAATASPATPVSRRLAGSLYGKIVPAPVKIDGVTIHFQ